jgi:hypothetical protein
MAGPILYSTNPWYATEIADRYRSGIYFAWVSECIDYAQAPTGSAQALVAPSSTPLRIYLRLDADCEAEDSHSELIKNYRKTFARLARAWLGDGSITQDQYDEIMANTRSNSWKIWRPRLYVIPREPIEAAGRLMPVRRGNRAAYGPELQIVDLRRVEFDIIELTV